jgi:hypothetical protein
MIVTALSRRPPDHSVAQVPVLATTRFPRGSALLAQRAEPALQRRIGPFPERRPGRRHPRATLAP